MGKFRIQLSHLNPFQQRYISHCVVYQFLLELKIILEKLMFLKFQACEHGRGAILLSVARGRVSEGIDFGESCYLAFMLLMSTYFGSFTELWGFVCLLYLRKTFSLRGNMETE